METANPQSDTSWAFTEFSTISLGDKRLDKRLISCAIGLSAYPQSSINCACEDWAATKGAYRLFNNDKVTPEKILSPHQSQTILRMSQYSVVLAVQDTTFADYTHHPKTSGLGPIGAESHNQSGFVKHTTLAVSVSGLPLGVLTDSVWARDIEKLGQALNRKDRPIDDKESYKWIAALSKTTQLSPEGVRVIHVCDREADIYEFLTQAQRLSAEYVIRATQDRRIDDQLGKLRAKVANQPIAGTLRVEVPQRDKRPARTAIVNLHFAAVTLVPPKRKKSVAPDPLPPIPLMVIWVIEVNPPEGVEKINWLLLTNTKVTDFDEAVEKVQFYSRRWQIEIYFKVLKSGCLVEQCRLADKARLQRYIAVMSVVAWRLFFMTMINRDYPNTSCTIILAPHEWQALYATIHKSTSLPSEPPTVNQAVGWIARLGGFLGRKSDAQPGVTVIWRGWQRLSDIAATWLLAHPYQDVGNS